GALARLDEEIDELLTVVLRLERVVGQVGEPLLEQVVSDVAVTELVLEPGGDDEEPQSLRRRRGGDRELTVEDGGPLEVTGPVLLLGLLLQRRALRGRRRGGGD